MKAKKIPGVPNHYKGAHFETENLRFFDDHTLVVQQFELLKDRFFTINYWKHYCVNLSADFKLFDANGSYVNRIPIEGDFIRIDIPGPGNPQTKGYDWVLIVKIDTQCYDSELERYLMTCRPSKSPGSKNKNIAHFYTEASSSNFLISRGKEYIKVGIYGRNEVANFSRTGLLGKVRNFMISVGGFLRLTKFQWKGLAEGLLDF